MKQLTLFIALGLLFFITGQIVPSIPIRNKTPYWAWIGVHYSAACRDDNLVIAPRDTVNIKSYITCQIKKIEGVLVPVRGDATKNITIQEWTTKHPGSMKNPIVVEIIPQGHGYAINASFW